ncbi:hypothetical protein ElyMa_001464300 [Elysia marginata]|uniref:Uncharacterized protein n=1 Tax=Elysia marginata TaxID=1093978 RepID=A0AAV4J061_9GAST|nr:hypothetical protein ElyMa_001464300 [Elysia marginata]
MEFFRRALRVLQGEFRLKNFSYNHPDPSAFWRYQWKGSDIEYLTLRLILALYITYAWIHEIANYYMVAVNHDALRNSTENNSNSIRVINITTTTTTSSISSKNSSIHPGTETTTRSTTTDYSMGTIERETWDTRRPWYVFLTLWSFTVLFLHLVLAAVLAFVFTLRSRARTADLVVQKPIVYHETTTSHRLKKRIL